jgi:hypothetical protein
VKRNKAPPVQAAHGSAYDEIGGSTHAVFTTEVATMKGSGADFVGVRLVVAADAPRMCGLSSWPWFFKPIKGKPVSRLDSMPDGGLLCGGFRLAASRAGGADGSD